MIHASARIREGVRVGIALALCLASGAPSLRGQDPPTSEPGEERFEVTEVEIRGLDLLDPPVRLRRPLPLSPGDTYSTELAGAAGRVVSEAFSERGRPYAVVAAGADLDREDGTARLTLTVLDPGPPVRFGAVLVEAEAPLDESVVRDLLPFAPGDPFQPSMLDLTRHRLERLPIVQYVMAIPLGLAEGDTEITTELHVGTVPDPRGPRLSGNVSSFRCLELQGMWRDLYFLGGPRLFTAAAGLGNLFASELGGNFPCGGVGEGEMARTNYHLRMDLAQPVPGEPLATVRAGAFVRRESRPRAYVLDGYGAQLGVDWPFGQSALVGVAYAPERTELRAAGFYYCAVFGACSEEEVQRLERARWLAPLEGRVLWVPGADREGGLTAPVGEGLLGGRPPGIGHWWIHARLAGAGRATGSEHVYGRAVVEGGRGWVLGLRSEAALRLRAGALRGGDDPVPPQVRFYSGGVESVRGVDQNLLGPLVLLATGEEAEELGCESAAGGCPEGVRAPPGRVDVRPRGGDLLGEANLEGRLRVARQVQLAAFVDVGAVRGERTFGDAEAGGWHAVVTPGIGIRYASPVGLLRLDVGYDPRGGRDVPLLTEVDGDLLHLGTVRWNPHTYGDPGLFREVFRRLHFGLAVGQPF